MRHIVSAVTIAAFAAGLFAPGLSLAQTAVSPELSERLRAAVAEREAALGLPDSDALAARLADGALRDEATLDDLVAPVALYPDALLAQVLAAAAYPDQIARAGALIDEGDAMTDQQLTDAIAAQDWDPSVLVLLSGFPTVIARMADDLDWTADLGGAMLHQDADVLAAVQRMRLRAEAAGNLQSNAAQVVDKSPEAIAIRPADPEKVYVPDYDPDVVYVSSRNPAPYVPSPYASTYVPNATYVPTAPAQVQSGPGFDMTTALVSGAVGFGAGYLVNQLVNDDDHDNKNKNKNKNDGWDGYWKRSEPIDWRDRRFYPRPGWGEPPRSWQEDRDRYWDRNAGRWRLDDAARRRAAEERRDLMPWMASADPAKLSDREQARMRAWREQARREAQAEAARERAAEQRRAERARAAAERRAAAARQDRREDRAALERRAAEERRAAAARQERREAQAAADRRAAVQEKREKQAAAERRAAAQERQAEADRRAAQERRAAAERQQERREDQAAAAARQKRLEQQRAEQRAAAAKAERAQARKAEAARAQAAQEKRAKAAAAAEARQAQQKQKAQAQQKQKAQAAETQRRQQKQQQQAAKKKCKPNDDRKECRQG